MPRYLVEQTFPHGLRLTLDDEGARLCLHVVSNNALDGVTWIHSYVTPDRRRAFYLCDAPTPEAIRRAAQRNRLPVDRITEVRILDPYFLV
ncbi:MAG: DUF4242 domain-containing protein [Chloroflexi bacterium]|nr:DUF4242 domain-containing protein [Chloroflexota bacterium]NLF65838.1 DUF4242 domain-containing protein [Chloroflexota bacterium]